MPVRVQPDASSSGSTLCSVEEKIAEVTVTAYCTSGTLPSSFTCPILHTIMKDPVCTPFATYERVAIERHLSRRGAPTDPVTGATLENTVLMPNQAIKTFIAEFMEQLRFRDPLAAQQLETDAQSALREAAVWAADTLQAGADSALAGQGTPPSTLRALTPPAPRSPPRTRPSGVGQVTTSSVSTSLSVRRVGPNEPSSQFPQRIGAFTERLDNLKRQAKQLKTAGYYVRALVLTMEWMNTLHDARHFVTASTGMVYPEEPIHGCALLASWAIETS